MAPYLDGMDGDSSDVRFSGIRVIIVGAGFAGLTAAIECTRKGHSCVVLDSVKEMKQLGDIISFGSNAGRIFQRWPGVPQKLAPICHKGKKLQVQCSAFRGSGMQL